MKSHSTPTSRITVAALAVLALVAAGGWAYFKPASAGADMTAAAEKYLASLDDQQRNQSLLDYDTPQRLDWHFIPKSERKGLQIKDMNEQQRRAAHALLRSALSEAGYDKAAKIMALETILHELEGRRPGGNIRDPERYYFTIFGRPADEGRWGLSVEGHHLSLNFAVEDSAVISSTPSFFGANPAIVKSEVSGGLKPGTRVLAKEEQMAFDLLHTLNAEQRQTAVIDGQAPRDIRAAGEPQPPTTAPDGIAAAQLNGDQRETLQGLIEVYARNMPADVAQARLDALKKSGLDKVHFAWAGADRPGIGHYYRIQGPTLLIELVNTQPDSAGNMANHIHSVWRDPAGDFAIPLSKSK